MVSESGSDPGPVGFVIAIILLIASTDNTVWV
jgi:hypothetical protein